MLLLLMGLGDFLGVWGLDKKNTDAEDAEDAEGAEIRGGRREGRIEYCHVRAMRLRGHGAPNMGFPGMTFG